MFTLAKIHKIYQPEYFQTATIILKFLQGAANKSNPLPCFVNISTTNRNF